MLEFYRFDRRPELKLENEGLQNIGFTKYNSKTIYRPVVVDSSGYIFDGKNRIAVEEWKRDDSETLLTGSLLEKLRISSRRKDLKVNDLSSISIIFSIEPSEDISVEERFKKLIELYSFLQSKMNIDLTGSIPNSLYNRYVNMIDIRKKSRYDSRFFYSMEPAYSSLFRMKEMRDSRKVVVIDINSMYPYIMSYMTIPNPEKLRYIDKPRDYSLPGIYRVKMNLQDFNFIRKWYYLRKDRLFLRPDPVEVETILYYKEIEYLSRWFHFELLEAVISDETIEHPFRYMSEQLYRRRLESSGIEKDLIKLELVLLSSMYSRRRYKRYKNIDNMLNYIEKELTIDRNRIDNYPSYIRKDRNLVLDIYHPSTIYSIQTAIYSEARIIMLRLIEQLEDIGEICYSNIDSLHISIEENRLEELKKRVKPSQELGGLKIESISDHAIWLDLGKYILFNKDGSIVKLSDSFKEKKVVTYRHRYLYEDYLSCSFSINEYPVKISPRQIDYRSASFIQLKDMSLEAIYVDMLNSSSLRFRLSKAIESESKSILQGKINIEKLLSI